MQSLIPSDCVDVMTRNGHSMAMGLFIKEEEVVHFLTMKTSNRS